MSRRTPINLQKWRQELQESLAESGVDQPINTSLLLIASAVERPKTWVLAHNDYQPSSLEIKKIQFFSDQMSEGRPLPYVLGMWEFFGRSFKVTPDVLIPRPETETLVEIALNHVKNIQNPKIIDVGTGSGAIAVSLAAELPNVEIIASDVSRAALRIARQNAQALCQVKIAFLQADLLTPLAAQFDLICANLPYIPSAKLRNLQVFQWEPRQALDGGETGLELILPLLQQARSRLTPGGLILLEIESSLGAASLSAGRSAFPEAQIQLTKDLTSRDRILEIRLS